jgi:hypothetical protein
MDGVVTVNTDASEKSESNRTDLTIPFLQKYPLMSLRGTRCRSNLRREKSLSLHLYELWTRVGLSEISSDITLIRTKSKIVDMNESCEIGDENIKKEKGGK